MCIGTINSLGGDCTCAKCDTELFLAVASHGLFYFLNLWRSLCKCSCVFLCRCSFCTQNLLSRDVIFIYHNFVGVFFKTVNDNIIFSLLSHAREIHNVAPFIDQLQLVLETALLCLCIVLINLSYLPYRRTTKCWLLDSVVRATLWVTFPVCVSRSSR
jgi:hypothetical protein